MSSFALLLKLSDELRPGYTASLGDADKVALADFEGELGQPAPPIVRTIYSLVRGTPDATPDEVLVDFMPGLRLLHVSELANEWREVQRIHNVGSEYVPFLVDFSSGYVCAIGAQIVALDVQDPGGALVSSSEGAFLETVCELYRQGIYHLADGLLDVQEDREVEVAMRMNPDASYW